MISRWLNWQLILFVALFALVLALITINLDVNPRPWQDEGGALSVAQTLVRDGVYGIKTSTGYQYFGSIQSIGPTVILPAALSFTVFGAGLLPGRLIAAVYSFLCIVLFVWMGVKLFGRRAALFSVLLLLGSQAVGFLYFGRQVLGEVPALALFLAGWLFLAQGIESGKRRSFVLAGVFLGLASITKAHFAIAVFGALALLTVLDLIWYRQRLFAGMLLCGVIALLCLGAWWLWQFVYFGPEIFASNAAKLGELAKATSGLNLRNAAEALQYLFSAESDHLFFYWGIPGLLYCTVLCLSRERKAVMLAFLVLAAYLWLAYFIFWIVPWRGYVMAGTALLALFVGVLWNDLLGNTQTLWGNLKNEIRRGQPGQAVVAVVLGIGMILAIVYPLQRTIRMDVLARAGGPTQLEGPTVTAQYLSENLPQDAIIETWERELAVMTNHSYHFPDQALLAKTHAAAFRGGKYDYALSKDYFEQYHPNYVVIGWFGRWLRIYDDQYLAEHAKLIATLGEGEYRYDVYQMLTP